MKIYIELDKNLQELLAKNKTDIGKLLRVNNIDARVEYEKLPLKDDSGAASKDLVPVIIAGSTAIFTVTNAITQILKTIYSKPHWVECDELEELRDAKGELVFDKDGKPLFKTVKKHILVEARAKDTINEFTSNLKGLILQFKTKQQEK